MDNSGFVDRNSPQVDFRDASNQLRNLRSLKSHVLSHLRPCLPDHLDPLERPANSMTRTSTAAMPANSESSLNQWPIEPDSPLFVAKAIITTSQSLFSAPADRWLKTAARALARIALSTFLA